MGTVLDDCRATLKVYYRKLFNATLNDLERVDLTLKLTLKPLMLQKNATFMHSKFILFINYLYSQAIIWQIAIYNLI